MSRGWFSGILGRKMTKLIPNLQLFLILIFASLLLFLLDQVDFLNLPKEGLSYLTTPIKYGLYKSAQTLQNQFLFLFSARFAAKENKALRQQLGELLSENASLRKSLTETRAELEQGEYLDPRTYKTVAARAIGLSRYLNIDKGAKDGVKINQVVIFKDSLLGQVITLSEKNASVRLTTDPDSKMAAFSINKDGKAKGVIVGQFGSEILMDKILHNEKITVGDLVYSEGLEEFLPRGLVLGQVQEVLTRENEVFKQAKIKPIFDIKDLDLTFVIVE